MKKTLLTTAIILGMALAGMAQQQGGGLFQRGDVPQDQVANYREGSGLVLPDSHGETQDQPGPLGSGIAVLLGLGGAYLVAKRRKED